MKSYWSFEGESELWIKGQREQQIVEGKDGGFVSFQR